MRWMTDQGICIAAGASTLALYQRLSAAGLPGVRELVPADGMLLVVLEPGRAPPPELEALAADLPGPQALPVASTRQHRIKVRFAGEDLPEVAARAGLDTDGLIGLMCEQTLRVQFLGFQPGFAYLGGLPPLLHLPRRARPRTSVPAGSLALAGGYCGIYPAAGPGGWHLLGIAETGLFDPAADPPARLQPGDTVRLVAA